LRREFEPAGAAMKAAPNIAADLSVSERILLFCLASGTEWKKVVTQSAVTRLIVRGLINRDADDSG
jgi:hypothetical protein